MCLEESYDSADNDDSNDPSYMPAMSASSNHNKVANEDITGRKLPLVFRAGFFKFIKKEFATMIGECVLCGPGSVYRGTEKSTSNFLSHLKVKAKNFSDFFFASNNPYAFVFIAKTPRRVQ